MYIVSEARENNKQNKDFLYDIFIIVIYIKSLKSLLSTYYLKDYYYLTILAYSVSITAMLKIRLQRVGRKHEPTFRLVLTDSKNSAKSGKLLEVLGNYDSRRGEKAVFDSEKIKYWMSKGAKTSDTVHNFLVSNKIIEGKKINVLPKKKPIVKEAVENGGDVVTATEEAPKEEVKPEETPAPAEVA